VGGGAGVVPALLSAPNSHHERRPPTSGARPERTVLTPRRIADFDQRAEARRGLPRTGDQGGLALADGPGFGAGWADGFQAKVRRPPVKLPCALSITAACSGKWNGP